MRETLRMCLVLTAIGAACAALMAFVDGQTKEPIEQNKGRAKIEAVKLVLPPFDNDPARDTITLNDGTRDVVFYRGRKGGIIIGAAFDAVAPNGYSGDIELIVGVDTAGVVTGIQVLKHLETPGLGSKIETPAFRDQYIGASIRDPETWAVVKDGGTFKQITGATISSRAVTYAVAAGLEFLEEHREEIFGVVIPETPAEQADTTGGT
jgi:electron transport complex protein RnfG